MTDMPRRPPLPDPAEVRERRYELEWLHDLVEPRRLERDRGRSDYGDGRGRALKERPARIHNSPVVIITKLEAAHGQLATAIRLFFNDGDIASVHTLACAAREIYEKHCKARGVERMFDHIRAAHPDRSEKNLWDVLNGSRNFLKHPETTFDLDAAIDLDDEANASTLFVACHDCAMLCGVAQPPEPQVFNAWFVATRFPDGKDDALAGDPYSVGAAEIQQALAAAFPALRGAALPEQKRIGREMLARV